jgi:PAS domain S-box-containing protein
MEVNDAFCDISGYSIDELIGKSHGIVNSGVHPPEFWAEMWRQISSGLSWRGDICNRAKDGSLYWVDSMIAPFIGDDGMVEKYVSIRTDITASKANQLQMAALTDRLTLVVVAQLLRLDGLHR